MDRQDVQKALDLLVTEYQARNPRSRELFERARKSLPGGNSRTGVYMAPFPFYAERGDGVYLFDADGHALLDFINNNTAMVLGHSHPAVVQAIQNQVTKGTGFSRPNALEIELAELLTSRVPSLELVRFCNSGSEAVLNALRAARAFTGKHKIAKFEGAYHGTSDDAFVSHIPPVGPDLGPADRPYSVPSSAGLPPATLKNVVVLPFNNPAACEAIIAENTGDLAAVIVEPLSSGAGFTLPQDGFLTRLRDITRRAGVLLIFDEIISYRISSGGAQEIYNVMPDLTCLAKIVAGGTPGGAFGGRADIMALYDPSSEAPKLPHSGTYNANPLSMAAGLATLRALTPEAYAKLDALTQRLTAGLEATFRQYGVQAQLTTAGSLLRVHFLASRPRNYREAAGEDNLLHRWLFFSLLKQGILWSSFANVSLPMETEHVDRLLSAVHSTLERHHSGVTG